MPLPETLPKWYNVKEIEEKGWTPKTEDIIEGRGDSDTINAWNEEECYKPTKPAST